MRNHLWKCQRVSAFSSGCLIVSQRFPESGTLQGAQTLNRRMMVSDCTEADQAPTWVMRVSRRKVEETRKRRGHQEEAQLRLPLLLPASPGPCPAMYDVRVSAVSLLAWALQAPGHQGGVWWWGMGVSPADQQLSRPSEPAGSDPWPISPPAPVLKAGHCP